MADNKKQVALILAQLRPGNESMEESPEMEAEEHDAEMMEHEEKLHAIADELISAVKHGDTSATVEALRAAFLCLDASPHVEGEHIEEMPEEDEEEGEGFGESVSHEVGEQYGTKKKYARGGSVKPSPGRAFAKGFYDQMSQGNEREPDDARPMTRAILAGR